MTVDTDGASGGGAVSASSVCKQLGQLRRCASKFRSSASQSAPARSSRKRSAEGHWFTGGIFLKGGQVSRFVALQPGHLAPDQFLNAALGLIHGSYADPQLVRRGGTGNTFQRHQAECVPRLWLDPK